MPYNFGNILPVRIPALGDDANIETAFKTFYYGEEDGATATQQDIYDSANSIAGHIQRLVTDKADLDGSTLTNTTLTAPVINSPVLQTGAIGLTKIESGSEGQLLRMISSSPTWVDPDTVPVSEAAKVENAATFISNGQGVAPGETFDGSVAKTISYNTIGAAASAHVHGNISSLGAIGTTSGLVIKTGTNGVLEALAAGTSGQFLKHDGTWGTPYILPTATTSILGGVKIDDVTIKIASGVISTNSASANTASTLVARDSSGNFAAGTITATLAGNSTSTTKGVLYGGATPSTTQSAGNATIFVQQDQPSGIIPIGSVWMW